MQRICQECKKEFETTHRKYCSDECFVSYRRKCRKLRDQEKKVEFTCLECGVVFLSYKKPRFCSISCGSKYNVKSGKCNKWINSSVRIKKGSYVKCSSPKCDKTVYTTVKNVNKLCSRECLSGYLSVKFIGENNPFFGKKLTEEQLSKQKKTLFENYGVTNAYMLSERRTTTKPQIRLHELLNENLPDFTFLKEKRVTREPKELFADIISFDKKVIVEFNGDFWHCNPEKYEASSFHPIKLLTAKEIWENDEKRIKILQDIGYRVFVVWEKDFKNDEKKVIKDLMEKILNG